MLLVASIPVWIGIALMMYIAAQHFLEDKEAEAKVPPKDQMWTKETVDRLKYIPTRY